MTQCILLVDDQRDILRLLHATLDTLKNADLEILEAPSGEEALLEAGRHRVDLLVADYLLPGITGVELMRKIRARHPEIKVILITGMTERKVRDEMLNAGAMAIFDKPIPLADFLDAVERALGLVRTIFPSEGSADVRSAARQTRLSDLLANFRQDNNAQAVFLLNERGLVLARAGGLHDSSMEVSLLSALMAIHNAGLKVSRSVRQEALDAYYIFSGGDHDLLFIPITALYALLVAGNNLATEERVVETVLAMLALRAEVEKSLKSMGVSGELASPQGDAPENAPALPSRKKKSKPDPRSGLQDLPAGQPDSEIEAALEEGKKKAPVDDLDSFWEQAAEKHSNAPANPDVISYEQARQMGLTPDEDK